jgi:hypothetical protein
LNIENQGARVICKIGRMHFTAGQIPYQQVQCSKQRVSAEGSGHFPKSIDFRSAEVASTASAYFFRNKSEWI